MDSTIGENVILIHLEPFALLSSLTLLAFDLDPSLRKAMLVLGILCFFGGIMMMFRHRAAIEAIEANEKDPRVRLFETRKFRRRGLVNAMISSMGCMMAAIYWADEARVFGILLMIVLTLLLGILGMALLDMVSVGLNTFSKTDDESREKLVQEVLRRREQKAAEDAEES